MRLTLAVLLVLPAVVPAQQIAIGGFYAPQGLPGYIAPGPGGTLWFTDGPYIGRATQAGQITRFLTQPPWSVVSLTAGPDGAI